ncbi:TrkA family potassium uptake protein [bacterium]|nr:TrkA family potassium uptake protein [bacterium]
MKRTFTIVGMGTFGGQTAKALYEAGAKVLAIDVDEREVERVAEFVTKAYCANVLDEDSIKAAGAFDADAAIIAVRRRFDVTVLATHLFKSHGFKEIIAVVDSTQESSAIESIGATHVVFPERDMAQRLARNLTMPDLAEQIPLGPDVGIIEVHCPASFEGNSLIELNLRKKFGVNVIAIKRSTGTFAERISIEVAPNPMEALRSGDVLVLLGKSEHLSEFVDEFGQKPMNPETIQPREEEKNGAPEAEK